ncbi:Arogenate dehydratase/prephenate dehydratase 1, chloroplastic [Porphyridium purpureum]|uniref:prephenate dehydratase n=1 Tax=Porphyridium purpureum TaxID=35688 RepID=A0A5J4YQA2_PORPP|nr:Arogenate dehydratase/prephenate dehydratase 1, chloroplastic [Porphyridium purpureum]|eukprot:POR5736..scf236_6
MMSGAVLRVGYQGVPGAYSEGAAVEFFGESGIEKVPCVSFGELLRRLNEREIDRAALPIENSLAGTIHQNYDLLLKYNELRIVGEIDFRVQHCLLVLPGVDRTQVKRAISHPMALMQCVGYLARNSIVPEEAFDTAGSAQMLRTSNITDAAAIASRRAAVAYGLDVLEEGIEDQQENYTRFFILARKDENGSDGAPDASATPRIPLDASRPCKTSVAFTLTNSPGALFKALSVFVALDIDLTKIESRHVATLLEAQLGNSAEESRVTKLRWEYIFYLDFLGSAVEDGVSNALHNLARISPFYRLLGSYYAHRSG